MRRVRTLTLSCINWLVVLSPAIVRSVREHWCTSRINNEHTNRDESTTFIFFRCFHSVRIYTIFVDCFRAPIRQPNSMNYNSTWRCSFFTSIQNFIWRLAVAKPHSVECQQFLSCYLSPIWPKKQSEKQKCAACGRVDNLNSVWI